MNEKYESVIKKYGFDISFNAQCINEVNKIKDYKNFVNRMDFTDLETITIDNFNTKDYDDALSIEDKGETFVLYVHISDVAHYINQSDYLLKTAEERAMSIYIGDYTRPMLPPLLSEDLVSLKTTNTTKPTISFIYEINKKTYELIDFKIVESLILVDENYTFNQVSKMVKKEKYDREMIKLLYEVHLLLNNKRLEKGTLEGDFSPYFTSHNEQKLSIAELMIKEFMLYVNQTTASLFANNNLPFVYRNHKGFTKKKIEKLNDVLTKNNITISPSNYKTKGIQDFINQLEEEDSDLVKEFVVKGMKFARYQSFNAGGHFTLGFDHYAHVTSPIRRYTDLFNQRIIKHYIQGNLKYDALNEILNYQTYKISKHITEAEYNLIQIEQELKVNT